MAWITTKRTLAKRSLEASDTSTLYVVEGSKFSTVEDTSDEKYKKATTFDGVVHYVLSASLTQI